MISMSKAFGPMRNSSVSRKRHQCRRMRFAGEKRHLANGFAGGNRGHQPLWAAFGFYEDTERSSDDKENGTIILAVAGELRSTRQAEPVGRRATGAAGPDYRPPPGCGMSSAAPAGPAEKPARYPKSEEQEGSNRNFARHWLRQTSPFDTTFRQLTGLAGPSGSGLTVSYHSQTIDFVKRCRGHHVHLRCSRSRGQSTVRGNYGIHAKMFGAIARRPDPLRLRRKARAHAPAFGRPIGCQLNRAYSCWSRLSERS